MLNTFTFAPKEELTAMLEGDDEAIDLMRAALCIAGEYDPKLNPKDSYQHLAKLTEQALVQVDCTQSLTDIAAKLCNLLHDQVGFCGNSNDYFNPDNSYINRVLETHLGIPVSLALVYMWVGKAIGLSIEGIGFPGNFLLRLNHRKDEKILHNDQPDGVIINPFFGQVLSLDDCKNLLAISSSNTLPFNPDFLKSIGKRAILRRMLSNLKGIYIKKADYVQALSLCNFLLLLDNGSIKDLLDRAELLEKLECYESAAKELEQLLINDSTMQGAQALQQKISTLRSKIQGQLH